MRNPLSFLLEELLVARQRFAWSMRRKGRSRSQAALGDLAHHRHHLDLQRRLVEEAGGEKAATPEDLRAARKAATGRLKQDRTQGWCHCGAITGVTGDCPARHNSLVPVRQIAPVRKTKLPGEGSRKATTCV